MGFVTRLASLTAILVLTSTLGYSVPCNDKQFRCNSGDQCIPINWRCDSDADCKDESDEKNCRYKPCSDQEFRCDSAKCISKSDLCDGFSDCPNGEDEKPSLCKKQECNSTTQFTCKRGLIRCIPLTKVCDDHDDCSDLSDESIFNCNKKPVSMIPTCRVDEFKCHKGGCVSMQFVCDGKKDCLDGSDEKNQTCKSKAHGCGSDEFNCSSDKKCISLVKRCDTFKDCSDGSDERNCNSLLKFSTKCPGDNDFYCGIPGKCVTQGWRCDGEPDCPNGADERDCTTTTCLPPKRACNRGNKCIHQKQLCDGKLDCDDGSDESACPEIKKSQECDPKKHFRCSSGQLCIPWEKVCNSRNDCPNGEDEAPGGKKSNCRLNPCDKAACTQLCQNRFTHAQCTCRKGYELQSDNATCVDVDECKIWGMCSQRCENTKGAYKCSCELGYEIKQERDGKLHCRANGDPSLILASQEYIRQYRMSVKEERPIVSDLINVAGLDYDLNTTSPVVFWSQPTPPAVMMAKINLTGKPERIQLYSKENSVPEGLAYDWVHKLLYMTDPGLKRIAVISLAKPKMKAAVIATGNIDEPRAIAVDPEEGWLYWTDWGRQAKISKIGMNGLYRTVLVKENIVLPNALALDRPRRRLYWSDAKLHSIYTIDFNGGDRRLIYEDPNIYPYSMSVFEDRVYWSDWHQESVLSVNKFSGENYQIIFSSHRISAIRVMHRLMQPMTRSHCQKHNPCSHYCLPSPRVGALRGSASAFSCGCPEGLVLLDNDRTCAASKEHSPSRVTIVPDAMRPHHITTTPKQLLTQQRRVGHVAGIVIGVVLMLTVAIGALMLFAYRVYSRKNTRSMNFDNPVYRKTPVDGEGDTEAQYPINGSVGLSMNNHSLRAPIWNGGVINGAVEA